MRKPIYMSNAELKKMFLTLNERFFNDRLDKNTKVHFVDDLQDEETGTELNGSQEGDEICLDSSLKIIGADVIQIFLLHEMKHADLPEYVGSVEDNDHGMLFQAKTVELFNKGAYDGLL